MQLYQSPTAVSIIGWAFPDAVNAASSLMSAGYLFIEVVSLQDVMDRYVLRACDPRNLGVRLWVCWPSDVRDLLFRSAPPLTGPSGVVA
jgi:hypothetical protein